MLIVLDAKFLTYEDSLYQVLMQHGIFISPAHIEYVKLEDETVHIGVRLERLAKETPKVINGEDNARW